MKPFPINIAFRAFFLVAIGVLLAFPVHGHSQSTSSLQGTAVDATGAVIRNVRVTLFCECRECPNRPCTECCPQSFSRTTTSDDEGRFRIERIPPGVYRIRGEASGFKTLEVHGVEISAQKASTVTLTFEAGRATSTETSEETARLLLRVMDLQTDKPLENATVTLLLQCDCKKECPTKPCSECCPSEKQVFTTITDTSGIVTFDGPPGTYRIDTAFRAYTKDSLIKLGAGETEKLKVTFVIREKQ